MIRAPRLSALFLPALFVAALPACGASPSPPPAARPAPEAASSAEDPPAAASLEVGDAVEGVLAGGRFAVPLTVAPGQSYVAVLSSGDGALGRRHRYRAFTASGAEGEARPVTGCVLGAVTPEPPNAEVPSADRAPAAKRAFAFRHHGEVLPIEAKPVAVGRHAVVWADVSADHPAVLDEAFAQAFLEDFERVILPRARTIFGVESDIDDDGRIALLFSPLTNQAAVAFFSGCDLSAACPHSNQGEILYLTPPNAIRPPYNTPRAIKEILAHELEHLLHFNQHVLRHPGLEDDPDGLYLHEGFGALAQDVTGFQAGNLYVTLAGLKAVDRTSLNPLLTEGRGYDDEDDGPLRGIAYLFTRWIYDRAGGDAQGPDGAIVDRGGPTLLRQLLAAKGSVASELLARADRERLVADFYTALAAPKSGATNTCFDFLPTEPDAITQRQRGADPYAEFHGQAMTGPSVQPPPGDGELLAGGADFLLVEPDAEGTTTLFVEVEAEAGARLRILRRQ